MSFIKTTLNSNCIGNYCNIFQDINTKISQYGKQQLDNIRYGFDQKVNYSSYEDLMIYKSIFENVINRSDLLCNININVLISNIRKITNSLC